MIDRVTPHGAETLPNPLSLRGYRDTGRTDSVFRQALVEELAPPAPSPGTSRKEVPSSTATWSAPPLPVVPPRPTPQRLSPQLQQLITEVGQVAGQMGYTGVSAQDILRAYRTGSSFLADYTA